MCSAFLRPDCRSGTREVNRPELFLAKRKAIGTSNIVDDVLPVNGQGEGENVI